MTVTAIVLAAGASSRMDGPNKLLLPFPQKPMIRRVVEAILGAEVGDIIVVTGREPEAIRTALNGLFVRFIHNSNYQKGMTSSIQAGVAAACGEGYLICLADMPLLQSLHYRGLVALFQEHYRPESPCICVPTATGKQRNPVLFSSHFRGEILAHRTLEGCRGIVQNHPDKIYKLPLEHQFFLDVDTFDAYQNNLLLATPK